MIRRIESSLETFKSLNFGPGLNLIVADKSRGATTRQTRNGSGKSSLVRIVHFLLGGNCAADSIFRTPTLNEEDFTMEFDLGAGPCRVTRGGETKRYVVIEDADTSSWPIQPTVDKKSGESRLKEAEWRDVLGTLMFGLATHLEPKSPTFRSLISYFARRESSGGFLDAQSQSTKQQNWDVQVNLSFLLGLDWRISHSLQQTRDREKSIETLKKESKSGALGEIVGNAGELRTRLAVAEKKANELKRQLGEFQVLPEYHVLEQEASQLAVRISELATQNAIDGERVSSLRDQFNEERQPDEAELVRMYEEIGIILPELVVRRLEEVREFHAAMMRNRRSHLIGQIQAAEAAIAKRAAMKKELDVRRLQVMNTLASHGALDQYTRLQDELSRQQAVVEELKNRSKLARQLESETTELKIERAQIRQKLTADLEDNEKSLDEAILTFEEFSRRISDHEGSLVVEATDNGPAFQIKVEGKESKGISNMQVFCFDLMLAVLWSRQPQSPGFLIHDSHLFDGMDSRQVAKAIEIGEEQARACGFQYIVCINSDQLESAEFSAGFDVDAFRNPVSLTDATKDGGLFGVRISHAS